MLALVVVRPRRWNEARWTMLGAAAMLALALVSPHEAVDATLSRKRPSLITHATKNLPSLTRCPWATAPAVATSSSTYNAEGRMGSSRAIPVRGDEENQKEHDQDQEGAAHV